MNSIQKKGIAVSLLVIVVGTGWLLDVYHVMSGVNWIWTGGLGLAGILALVLGGLNQLTILIGPFLLVGSILSILRQTGWLSVNVEVPILLIVFGILLLLSYVSRLPLPESLKRADTEPQN
jgi:hypothetical protein